MFFIPAGFVFQRPRQPPDAIILAPSGVEYAAPMGLGILTDCF
jgi:hypothetical protein